MTDPAASGAVLPAEWARLHPLSPVVRTGRAVVALLTAVGLDRLSQSNTPYVDLGILVLAVVAGVVSWCVTRWRIHDGELQLDTGLVRRQQIRVPLTRIQGVDLVRPLLARMLGVSEVRLVLAGRDSGRARLSYLGEQRATVVRAQLLALAHGLADSTPEPPERPVLAVSGGRIVASALLSTRFVIAIVLLVVTVVTVVVDNQPGPAVGVLVPYTILAVALTGRRVIAEWEFQVAEAPDGLRLRSGLLQTRAETIPYGRVQAVRWVEPLWWRPLGWVRLEVDVARRRGRQRGDRESGETTRALLPVGSREQAQWLLSRVLPGADAEPDARLRAPARARWRAPLSRRRLRVRHDSAYLVCGTGRLRPASVVVPLAKLQSLRWSQGPVSRLLRLASVEVDTAGQRFTARARFRDEREAWELASTLPDLAAAARRGS